MRKVNNLVLPMVNSNQLKLDFRCCRIKKKCIYASKFVEIYAVKTQKITETFQ